MVKVAWDRVSRVFSPEDIRDIFLDRVLGNDDRIVKYNIDRGCGDGTVVAISTTISINGLAREIHGRSEDTRGATSGTLAVGAGLQISFQFFERKWTEGDNTRRVVFILYDTKGGKYVSWGGIRMISVRRQSCWLVFRLGSSDRVNTC